MGGRWMWVCAVCFLLLGAGFAAPARYLVSVQGQPSEAYYTDLETGQVTTVPLAVKVATISGMPTLDAFVASEELNLGDDYPSTHYRATVIAKTGKMLRHFDEIMPASFLHDPVRPVYYFFTGYQDADGGFIVRELNRYDYERDTLQKAPFFFYDYVFTGTYLSYNPMDDRLYFGSNYGPIYAVSAADLSTGVVKVHEGIVHSEDGTMSVCCTDTRGDGMYRVRVFQDSSQIHSLVAEDLEGGSRGSAISFAWVGNETLLILTSNGCYVLDLPSGALSRSGIDLTGTVYLADREVFCRLAEKDDRLTAIPAAEVIGAAEPWESKGARGR